MQKPSSNGQTITSNTKLSLPIGRKIGSVPHLSNQSHVLLGTRSHSGKQIPRYGCIDANVHSLAHHWERELYAPSAKSQIGSRVYESKEGYRGEVLLLAKGKLLADRPALELWQAYRGWVAIGL